MLGLGEPYVNKKGYKTKRWLCECDCGNTTLVRKAHLESGAIQSCGCIKKEMLHDKYFKDLTGLKFGRLTVLEQTESRIGKNRKTLTFWKCLCECGNIVEVYSGSLTSGLTTSCGCFQKEKAKENGLKYKRDNIYDLTQKYGIGYLYNSTEKFYFDIEDYDKIKNYYWTINNNGYVITGGANNPNILMHRLVLDVSNEYEVDHINHNTNDNRKENLRIVTRSQNQMNLSLKSNNTSGVTGVYFDNTHNYWVSKIQDSILGYFSDFDEAVKMRKEAEKIYFGEYSYDESMKKAKQLNIPIISEEDFINMIS